MSRMQRSIVAFVLACGLCLPGVALAGGWLVMTLDELPAGNLIAGQEVALGFVARQHGERPINDVDAVLTFTHRESGQQTRVNAVQEGPTGHFVARFTPPTAGAWPSNPASPDGRRSTAVTRSPGRNGSCWTAGTWTTGPRHST